MTNSAIGLQGENSAELQAQAVAVVAGLWCALDMLTVRLGMEPLTAHEADTLSKATIPVLEKYGVPLGGVELTLALTVFGVYAPKWATRKPRPKIASPYKAPMPQAQQEQPPAPLPEIPQGLPTWKVGH